MYSLLLLQVVFILLFCGVFCGGPEEPNSPKKKMMRTYSKVEHQVTIQEHAFEDIFDDRYDIINEDFQDVLGDSLLNPLGESLLTNCSLGASLLNHSYPETSNSFRFEENQVPSTSTPLKQKLSNDVYLFDIDPNCSPVSDNVCLEPLDDTIISMEEESLQCESNSDHSDSPNSSKTAHNDIDPEQFHDIKAIPVRSSPSHRFKNTKLTANKLVLRYTKTISILQCQKIICCVRKCARSITIKQMKDMRLRFWSQNLLERHQWILDKMKESQQFVFNTEVGRICQKTFIALFGINKNAYYSIRRRYLQGSSYTLDRKKYRKRSDKFINALIWLEEYATFRADRMPDSQTALLPYGTRRIRIYEQYHQENEKETQLKRSSFMLMWSKYLPHLKIKQTNSFSKCTTCTSIERQLEMEHDHVKRAKLMKLRAEHNDGQMAERKYYYSKRKQAVDSSSEYLSLIVDGMDQAKTALPHFVGRTAKAVTSADKVSSHITGVIAHGQNRFKTFLDLCQYPHDSNLTLNILLFVLKEISRMMDNKLPPILYLQADNCWRENKNKYIISFCELLVHLQIFREVHLSFLVVGHTHEDIDAAFSKISEKLRTKDAETLPTLLKIIPDVSEIKFLYNIRDWLIPVINNFKQHTDPLHYRFKRDTQADVVNIYQKKTQDKPWVKLTFGAFSYDNKGKPILPKGVPKLVQPSFERKINTKRLNSCISSWNCLFRDQIQQTSKIWWTNFVKYIEKMETSALFRSKEISETANWILPKLPKLNRYEEPNTSDQQIPNELIQMVQDERRQNEVIVIPKKFTSKGKKKGNDKGQRDGKKKTGKQPRSRNIYMTYVGIPIKYNKHCYVDLLTCLLESLLMFLCGVDLYRTFLIIQNICICNIIWYIILEQYVKCIALVNIQENYEHVLDFYAPTVADGAVSYTFVSLYEHLSVRLYIPRLRSLT